MHTVGRNSSRRVQSSIYRKRIRYEAKYYFSYCSVTDSTTSLSPLLSTTSVQIECLGCEITKQVDESPANSKLSKGAVIAISLSACVVVLLTVGILFVFLKRAALVKSNTVQMQEISVEKQTAETAGN